MKQKKKGLKKRILALSLAGILCFGSVPQSVYASESSDGNIQETTQSDQISEETAEDTVTGETGNTEPEIVFPGAVRLKEAATPEDMAEEAKTEVAKHTRLIVVSESDLTECYGATECIRGYGNLHILTYEDATTCENAYAQFTAAGMSVEYDETVEAYEEETEEAKNMEETLEDTNKETKAEEQEKATTEKKEEKQEIVVAVIDTGADSSSNILKGRIKDDGYIPDTNGHGTLMAEIIASNTGEEVKILPIQAFDENGKGTVSTTYLAIMEAIEKKADIINLSVSGKGTSPMLASAIRQAKEAGIPVIVSAGNNGADTTDYMPGNITEALTVSAVTEDKESAAYSNHGKEVDFCAIGTVTKDNGTKDTSDDVTYEGTSVSAAYLTAYAAMILKENPQADVEACLKESAEDLGETGWDSLYGYGYVSRENIISNIEKEENKESEEEKKDDSADVITKEDGEQELQTAASNFTFYQYGNGTVGVELRNFSSYGDMRIAVWCESVNGQDDIVWYNMTKRDDGVWIYTFPVTNHAQEGWYAVHAYSGSNLMEATTFEIKGATSSGCSLKDTSVTAAMTGYAGDIKAGSNSITKVQLAVWTEVNGQDDLFWYDMWYDANWGGYVCLVSLTNHKNLSYGVYNAHCYVTDSGGIRKLVAVWRDNVSALTSYNQNMSRTGYHVEKVGTENCHHDASECAYVVCRGEGIAPSDNYLWDRRYVYNPTPSHPLNVTWRWDPDFSNFGIGNDQISHQVLKATVDGWEIPVAAPYWCPDGYAGYSYYYRMFSYCDKCDKWLYVGAMHKWLGCARGDVGTNEYQPMSNDHPVDVWGLKPNQYTLRFHGNGATSGSMADQSCSYDVDYNVSKNQFQRTGYTFKGWSRESNSGSIAFTDQQRVSKWDVPHGWAIDLYAVWEPSAYYINYDLNGATYIDQNTLNSLNSVEYGIDTLYSVPDANTFANKYNKVTYDANGGTCTSNGTGGSYDEGYSAFLGWDDNTVIDTNNGLLYDCYGYQSTTTFNAAYYANIHPDLMAAFGYDKLALWNHYCNYGKNEGRPIRSGHGANNLDSNDLYVPGGQRAFRNLTDSGKTAILTARWKDPVVKLPTPTREGYTFLGWYKEDETYVGKGGDSYTLSGTDTLYAKWKEHEYTLVFDGNGADIGSMESLTVHYTDTLTLPKNLYENTTIPCTYMGWIHDKDALKADYGDEEELEVKKIIKKAGKEAEDGATITLYAFWDIAPEIEAKDWYIGKEMAENMTEEQLLERAKSTDREDGDLERGKELVVVDFDKEDFLHLGQIGSCTVTFQATDSAGNITYKDIKVEVSEDGWLDMPYYIRFISEEFYGKKPESGGCVDGSVWNEIPEYKQELTDAFARIKNNTGVITYVFKRDDIKASHDFTEAHGFGEYEEDGALNLWLDAFAHCKQ